MNILIIIKFIALFVAIWFTMINIVSMYAKEYIPAINFIINALSITIFVFIQFKLY